MPAHTKFPRPLAMSLRAKANKGATPKFLSGWLLEAHGYALTEEEVAEVISDPSSGETSRVSSAIPSIDGAVPEGREARVMFIVNMMVDATWPVWPEALAFRRSLAAKWGTSESAIKSYAAEAHRVVALDPDDRDQLRAKMARNYQELAEEIRLSESRITGLPDWGSVIKARDNFAKFAGIEFEQKVRLSGSVSLEDIDDLRAAVTGQPSDGKSEPDPDGAG